ncbi:major facilitator superfamily domain-containing protein [Xylariales sp. PMI_506]|nr:major facilitator superfamily domain-containing protein [Xylariales sp. PMI_506]
MATSKHGPKLPSNQLAILAIARFAEPLAMTSVFPYLPEMIASFGIDRMDVAKWAGATSSVFSLAQSVTAVAWGRASDRFGRKPAIMCGLLCTMTCFLFWGFSSSLTMAITVRAIQGACNGNVGIIRTMVAEMVPERELQPRAFSIMPLVWSIGSIFGPAFGGFFAKPAEQFPSLFGNSAFFKAYPFALPNILASFIFMISLTTALLFLKETLASKRHSRDWGLILGERLTASIKGRKFLRARRYSFQDDEATAPLLQTNVRHEPSKHNIPQVVRPTLKEVFTRQSSINLLAYTFLALHSVAYDQVLPVFLNYPRLQDDIDRWNAPFEFSSGFGLSFSSIGTIFTIYGVVCGLVQFLIFPPLCTYFGVLKCFRACCVVFPFVYVITPFTTLVEDETRRLGALLVVMVIKAFCVIIGFPCTTILLTNSASSLNILGTLNGFATTLSAIGRATGPAVAGLAFTWGVKRNFIAAPWWLLAVIAVFGAIPAWWIEEGDGPSGSSSTQSSTPVEYSDDDETAVEDEQMSKALPSSTTRSRSILDRSSRATARQLDAREHDAVIADPTAHDDLPLVGSWKSANAMNAARQAGLQANDSSAASPNYGSFKE